MQRCRGLVAASGPVRRPGTIPAAPTPCRAGHSAWQLLQRLASLHLQHAPLDAGVMVAVRAHLLRLEAPALQQLALAYGPLAATQAAGTLGPQEADACRRLPGELPGARPRMCPCRAATRPVQIAPAEPRPHVDKRRGPLPPCPAGRLEDQGSPRGGGGLLSPRASLAPSPSLPRLPSYRGTADSAVGLPLPPIKQAALMAANSSRHSLSSRSMLLSDVACQVCRGLPFVPPAP